MKKNIQQMNINYRVMPVFSDRSITASQVASLPKKGNPKKAERKEGTIRLIFIDSVTNSSVADVVITPIAAEQLVNGIRKSLEKLHSDIKNPDIPQHQHMKPAAPDQQTYIG